MTEQTETKPANEFSVASTGARRSADADAIRLDLIPQLALKEVARVLAKGAESHGTYNWRKGTPHSTCINHCLNHLNQYLMGDRNTPHLAHAICNLMFLIEYLTIYPQGNDLLKAEDFLPLVELDGDPLYREAKRRARLMSADVSLRKNTELNRQAVATPGSPIPERRFSDGDEVIVMVGTLKSRHGHIKSANYANGWSYSVSDVCVQCPLRYSEHELESVGKDVQATKTVATEAAATKTTAKQGGPRFKVGQLVMITTGLRKGYWMVIGRAIKHNNWLYQDNASGSWYFENELDAIKGEDPTTDPTTDAANGACDERDTDYWATRVRITAGPFADKIGQVLLPGPNESVVLIPMLDGDKLETICNTYLEYTHRESLNDN